MTSNDWPAERALCCGINCAIHAKCQRYLGAENNRNERQVWIGRCGDEFNGFIPIHPVAIEPACCGCAV